MLFLNPGRYVVADPGKALSDDTCKELWRTPTILGIRTLSTDHGSILAFPTGESGSFATNKGKCILTETAYIAFIPYEAIGKLLPFGVIRLALSEAALLYIDASSNIVLDGRLKIFCRYNQPCCGLKSE